MLDSFRWLALESWYLDRSIAFYEEALDCPVTEPADGVAVVTVGGHELRLLEPGPVPRGGVHVHYALAAPPDRYDAWVETFEAAGETWEHDFGDMHSVYMYDPDDHCIEIGDNGTGSDPITGVFEVVLEVELLERAVAFYEALGFTVIDTGSEGRRTRLDGPIAVELWEPRRGIADARGGVHTHLAFTADDPAAAVAPVTHTALSRLDLEAGVRVQDPDGHYLTIMPPA